MPEGFKRFIARVAYTTTPDAPDAPRHRARLEFPIDALDAVSAMMHAQAAVERLNVGATMHAVGITVSRHGAERIADGGLDQVDDATFLVPGPK